MQTMKKNEPIPEQFASYEEAAEFWDSHDTTDYPEAFKDVEIEACLRRKRFEIEIDPDVVLALQIAAKDRGITISRLASDLLKHDLARVG
jgi:hypothetical protein